VSAPITVEIVNFYNTERARVAGVNRELPLTPSILADAARLAVFCRRHKLDPKLWIHSQFAKRGWRHSVRLSSMVSDHSLKLFRECGEEMSSRVVEQSSLADRCQRDEVRDGTTLTPLAEAAKRALIGSPSVCMASSRTLTLGHTPASPICQTCPLADTCRSALPGALVFKREHHARRAVLRT